MFFTNDDPAREKYGAAKQSHPQEYAEKLQILLKAGVTIDKSRPFMAYSLAKNVPGLFILDENASVSAFRHEFQHFLDDREAGYLGLKAYREDDEVFWQFEFRAYWQEVKFAREDKDFELGRKIVRIMRKVRNKIFGRQTGKEK